MIRLVALTLLALVVVLSGWLLVEFYRFMREPARDPGLAGRGLF